MTWFLVPKGKTKLTPWKMPKMIWRPVIRRSISDWLPQIPTHPIGPPSLPKSCSAGRSSERLRLRDRSRRFRSLLRLRLFLFLGPSECLCRVNWLGFRSLRSWHIQPGPLLYCDVPGVVRQHILSAAGCPISVATSLAVLGSPDTNLVEPQSKHPVENGFIENVNRASSWTNHTGFWLCSISNLACCWNQTHSVWAKVEEPWNKNFANNVLKPTPWPSCLSPYPGVATMESQDLV